MLHSEEKRDILDAMDERKDPADPLNDFVETADLEPARVVCAACGHRLTTRDRAIEVDGRHDHRCVNPSGFTYDIVCFSEAPGVTSVGEPDTWFSWFRGAAWQISVCGGCHVHVGWRFSGRKAPFFALIVERIRG